VLLERPKENISKEEDPLPPIKPTSPTFTQADQLFMELKSYMPRPKQKQPYLWSDWVSDHTKQLIRKRCDLAKTNTHKKDNTVDQSWEDSGRR